METRVETIPCSYIWNGFNPSDDRNPLRAHTEVSTTPRSFFNLFISRSLQFCKYKVLFLFLYLSQLSALLLCHQTAVNCEFNQWIFSILLQIIYPHNTLMEERCTFPIPGSSLSKY